MSVSDLLNFNVKTKEPFWVDVQNAHIADIKNIGKHFEIHPLTIEDICVKDSREKIEIFGKVPWNINFYIFALKTKITFIFAENLWKNRKTDFFVIFKKSLKNRKPNFCENNFFHFFRLNPKNWKTKSSNLVPFGHILLRTLHNGERRHRKPHLPAPFRQFHNIFPQRFLCSLLAF